MTPPKLEYVTTAQLAALLGVCRATIHNWQRAGKIPKSKRSGDKRIFHLPSVLEACRRNCLALDPIAFELVDRSN